MCFRGPFTYDSKSNSKFIKEDVAKTVTLDVTHSVIHNMFTMIQFYLLVTIMSSSMTHELFRTMLFTFPDLQEFLVKFNFSPAHTSEWCHLQGNDPLRSSAHSLLHVLAELLLPAQELPTLAGGSWPGQHWQGTGKGKVRLAEGIRVGHRQPLLHLSQITTLFPLFPFITSFLYTKDST